MSKKLTFVFVIVFAIMAFSSISSISYAEEVNYTFDTLWELKDSEAVSNPESVFYDSELDCLWVTNTGDGSGETLTGFISKLSTDGSVIDTKFSAEDLKGPRGSYVYGGYFYTAEVDALVKMDRETGEVTRYPAQSDGPQQLNDIVAAPDGTIYVSDLLGNKIWGFDGSEMTIWLESEDLTWPNGLRIEDGVMYVSPWGLGDDTWATDTLSHMLAIDMGTQEISSVGDGVQHGYMDGLVRMDYQHFIVTNWWDGKVIIIDSTTTEPLAELTLEQSTGDIFYRAEENILYVPIGNSNALTAIRVY